MKNSILDILGEENPFRTFLSKSDPQSFDPKISIPNRDYISPLFPLFIELIKYIKNSLASISNLTQLSQGKFSDKEFGDYFKRLVIEDIEKIDLLLNNFLDYIKVNFTIKKTNTVHNIIEEVFKKHHARLEEKRIRIFKKFEKDLPEIIVPDEELRYILNSIIQYAMIWISIEGSIWCLTKSLITPSEMIEDQTLLKKDGKQVEITLIFTGYKKTKEQFSKVMEISDIQKGEQLDLELRLVNEIVKRNRGKMKFAVDEKNAKTFISLQFPEERRNIIYYQQIN